MTDTPDTEALVAEMRANLLLVSGNSVVSTSDDLWNTIADTLEAQSKELAEAQAEIERLKRAVFVAAKAELISHGGIVDLDALMAIQETAQSAMDGASGPMWRPAVMAMADAMEEKLRANDHKPGWEGDSPRELLYRLRQEINELDTEVAHAFFKSWHSIPKEKQDLAHPFRTNEYRYSDPEEARKAQGRIRGEAADVANFAMMIAEVCAREALKGTTHD